MSAAPSSRLSSVFGPDRPLRLGVNGHGDVATFYSYKGGTGRSLALVNCAGLLAQQLPPGSKPLLLIDFDLEAPGLHRYLAPFLPQPMPADQMGTLDLFEALQGAVARELPPGAEAPLDDEAAARVVDNLDLPRYVITTTLTPVCLIQAGRFDESYDRRLSNFQWETLFSHAPAVFRCLAERLAREYSLVLIDSRTGLSDVTGVCTMLMPDVLVMVFTPNNQSLTGVEHLVRKAAAYRRTSSDLRELRVYPLPSRVDIQVEHFRRVWRMGQTAHPLFGNVTGYQPMFLDVFRDHFDISGEAEARLNDYFDIVQVPHSSDYAYGERLCFTDSASNDSLSLRGAYEQFLPWLITGAQPWQRPAEVLAEQQAEQFLIELGAQSPPADDAGWHDWLAQLTKGVGDAHEQILLSASHLSDERRLNMTLAVALAWAFSNDIARSAPLLDRLATTTGADAAYSALARAIPAVLTTWRAFLTPLEVATEDRVTWLAAADRLLTAMKPGRTLSAQWQRERTSLLDHAPWLCLSPEALRAVRETESTQLGDHQRDGMLRSIANLSLARKAEGDLAAARVLAEQVVEISRRVLGEEHPDTLKAQNDLALTLRAQGDAAGADALETATRTARRRASDRARESTASARRFRIFLSSAGDVAEERRVVRTVVEQLGASAELREKIRLEVVAWDDVQAALPMTRGDAPQEFVSRATPPSKCDLTIVLFWTRLGTPLPRDLARGGDAGKSGMEWELSDALAAGKPVLIYRRSATPRVDLDDPEFDEKRAQYEAVKRFASRLEQPLHVYQTPADLEPLLRRDVQRAVQDALAEPPAVEAAPAAEPRTEMTRDLEVRLTRLDGLIRASSPQPTEPTGLHRHQIRTHRRKATARVLALAVAEPADEAALGALNGLERGDCGPACALLRRLEEQFMATPSAKANRLAHEQGALAYGQDSATALAAYQRAVVHDPNDAAAYFFTGELQARQGLVDAALVSFRQAIAIARRQGTIDSADSSAETDLSESLERAGELLRASGELTTSLGCFREALAIAERRAARDATNLEWQRVVAVTRHRIGDVLSAQGDGPAALAAYRAGLAQLEQLATRDPSNTRAQRDLLSSHNRIGAVLVEQGYLADALGSYRAALAIAETLATREPANIEWQHSLALAHNLIGAVLGMQGDGAGALTAHRLSDAITERLMSSDPTNTTYLRELMLSRERIGDLLNQEGNSDEALKFHRQSLAIANTLVLRDPANAEWHRDVSVSRNKVADMLLARGDRAEALAMYRASLATCEELVARDPENGQWRRDQSVSLDRIGDVLAELEEQPGATDAYRQALEIREELARSNPSNAQLLGDLVVSYAKMAFRASGQAKGMRRTYLQRGREILNVLKSDRASTGQDELITWFDDSLAALDSEPGDSSSSSSLPE